MVGLLGLGEFCDRELSEPVLCLLQLGRQTLRIFGGSFLQLFIRLFQGIKGSLKVTVGDRISLYHVVEFVDFHLKAFIGVAHEREIIFEFLNPAPQSFGFFDDLGQKWGSRGTWWFDVNLIY